MRTIGLTGGIAGGKSAVSKILAAIPQVDADEVSRRVVSPGSTGLKQVAEALGQEVIQPDGNLNRAKVREMIATSRETQQTLNGILHPLIIATIKEELAEIEARGEPVGIVSAALMLETGSYKNYGDVILVTAPESVRLQRLIERDGMDENTARALMAKQWPDEKKRPLATVEIVNDGDWDALVQRTRAAWSRLGLSPDF